MGNDTRIITFFHEATSTAAHLIVDAASGDAAVIDPVLDFEPANGRTSTAFASRSWRRSPRPAADCAGCWKPIFMPII